MPAERVKCERCTFPHSSDVIAVNKVEFNNFLEAQGIKANDPVISELKKFWNKAVDLSYEIATGHEGTCFGIDALKAK